MDVIRVYAVGDLMCPMVDETGRTLGRYVARHPDGKAIPEGIEVPDMPYYRRRIAKGEIADKAPTAAPPEAADTVARGSRSSTR